jgi:hypothetical protein
MPTKQIFKILLCMSSNFLLISCGTYVPEIAEVWDGPNGTRDLEFNIKKAVFCEIQTAVKNNKLVESINGKVVPFLPDDWAAQVTLSLEVDETTALNPGVALNTPMASATNVFNGSSVITPQLFSVGAGGTLSSQSSRIDKFNMYYSVKDLRRPTDPQNDICNPTDGKPDSSKEGSSLFLSDLGITRWLNDALLVDQRLPSSAQPAAGQKQGKGGQPAAAGTTPKPDTISYEIKFIVVSSGNVTPTWKLVRLSANTGSAPFFGMGRTRTHDLILTLGPSAGSQGGKADMLHLSSQIGSATAGSLRPLLSPLN